MTGDDVAAVAGFVLVAALVAGLFFGARAVGYAAERKGRSFATWNVIALFFLLPAAIAVACMRDLEFEDDELRPCPACAEAIQPQARLCWFCHSEVASV
jgi:hypothetical protein